MERRRKNLQELFEISQMTQRLMHMYMHRRFEELGVAPPQVHLLHLIGQMQPVNLKKLADGMRLTPGAITQLVDGLVRAGYVDRLPDEKDRRSSVVTLNAVGQDKIKALTRQKQTLLAEVANDLDDNELETYLHVQQKMLAYLETNCRNIKK